MSKCPQCPDPALEPEASGTEMGTHWMLQDRWGLTMVCKSEVPQGFELRRQSRHRALQPVPKLAARLEHTALGQGRASLEHPPWPGLCWWGLPRIDFGNVPHHLGFILIISNPLP